MVRNEVKQLSIVSKHMAELGGAKPGRVQRNSIENWLQISRRGGDDVQDGASGCLLFECFTQFSLQQIDLATEIDAQLLHLAPLHLALFDRKRFRYELS